MFCFRFVQHLKNYILIQFCRCDSASGYTNFRFFTPDQAQQINQHTLFVSELMLVMIRAEKNDESNAKLIWHNYFVNSPYG